MQSSFHVAKFVVIVHYHEDKELEVRFFETFAVFLPTLMYMLVEFVAACSVSYTRDVIVRPISNHVCFPSIAFKIAECTN